MAISAKRKDDYNKFINLIHENERDNNKIDSDKCYITLANAGGGEWKQHHYRKQDFIEKCEDFLAGTSNTYMSINSFYLPQRKAEYVRRVNAIYCEFDNHNEDIKMTEYHIQALLFVLKEDYFGTKVPYPSSIVRSGRGIHIYWKIEDIPKQLVGYWTVIRDKIIEELKAVNVYGFMLDTASTDISRVMRIAGSKNLKANKLCCIEEIDGYKYTLSEIAEGFFPEILVKKEKKKYTVKTKIETEPQFESKVIKVMNAKNLHFTRLRDLVKLMEIRGGYSSGGREDGDRELLCFLYRYWGCCISSDKEKALKDTLDFNKKFRVPLSEEEVKNATKSAEKAYMEWEKAFYSKNADEKVNVVTVNGVTKKYKHKGYNYKTETLIKLLQITIEEQRQLETLISLKVKRERDFANRKEKRRNSRGLTSKQQEIKDLNEEIIKLKKDGKKNKDIAETLNITIKTLERYVTKLKREQKL